MGQVWSQNTSIELAQNFFDMLIRRFDFDLNKSKYFCESLLEAIKDHSNRSYNRKDEKFSQKIEYFCLINNHEYTYFNDNNSFVKLIQYGKRVYRDYEIE